MHVALRVPRMTQADFFGWAEAQAVRHEFDEFEPVAKPADTVSHSLICQNVWAVLRAQLRGGPCTALGPHAGLATVGDAVRYPDAMVPQPVQRRGAARLVPGAMVVFEVLSPSGRVDRIDKVREYHAVASVRRYVILEHETAGATVLERERPDEAWRASALTAGDVLVVPEIGIEVPVAAYYEGLELPLA